MNTHLLIGTILALTTQAGAACVAEDPVATARRIYDNDRGFAFNQSGRDPGARADYLSAGLYSLLLADWRCQDAAEGICALDADPWINAQDGEALPPITFTLAARADASATVRMTYRFGYAGINDPPPTPAEARLEFIRDAASGCWHLDDLVGPESVSLKRLHNDYHHAVRQPFPSGGPK